MLEQLQRQILSLFGPAFDCNADRFCSTAGEPLIKPANSSYASPEVKALIERALGAVGDKCVESAGASIPNQHGQTYDERVKALIDEASQLDDNKWSEFATQFPIAMLAAAVERLDSLPSSDQLANIGYTSAALGQHLASVRLIIGHIRCVLEIANATKGRPGALSVIGENLGHDALNHMTNLRFTMDRAVRVASQSEVSPSNNLRHALDIEAPFLKQVVAGTKSIATGTYEIAPHNAALICVIPALANALSFKHRVYLNGSMIYSPAQNCNGKNISLRVKPDTQLFVDPNALGLVLYNLIKNPIKLARSTKQALPSVDIEIVSSPDEKCTSIFVRDDSIGVSYDTLRKYFTDRARNKLNKGMPLHGVEELLLDEVWSQLVPPTALLHMLCDRGASIGGGTGIGLAIAKQVINGGHQGYIEFYSHPSSGFGVQILLPNVASTVSAEQRWQITLTSLRQQLARAAPFFRYLPSDVEG